MVNFFTRWKNKFYSTKYNPVHSLVVLNEPLKKIPIERIITLNYLIEGFIDSESGKLLTRC